LGGREHKIEGVGAETFVRLLRFAYGNGLYASLPSPLENQAFFDMLDTLQITTFGRNHVRNSPSNVYRVRCCVCDVCDVCGVCGGVCVCVCVCHGLCALTRRALAAQRLMGTGMVIERPKAMLRDDFIRLFHTANRIAYTPTTTDEPPSPSPSTPTDRQPEPTPPQPPLSELKSAQQGIAKSWWSWWSWWGKQQPETNKMLLEREKQAAAAIAEAATMAASGSMPPGMLLNEAFLRRHGWFADLRVRCVSDEPDVSASGGGGGEEEEDEEGEQEESEKGHGEFVCHKFLLCVRSPYFQGTGLRTCVWACRVLSLTKQVLA
jgi:hypothetical protein